MESKEIQHQVQTHKCKLKASGSSRETKCKLNANKTEFPFHPHPHSPPSKNHFEILASSTESAAYRILKIPFPIPMASGKAANQNNMAQREATVEREKRVKKKENWRKI